MNAKIFRQSMVLSAMMMALGAVGLAGCGGDDESGSGGASATGATSASSSDASSTSAASTSGSGGSGGGDPNGFTPMNGCDPATAEDLQDLTVEIQFPVNGFKYSPNCVLIHATHSINWKGIDGSNFVSHPLVGGEVVDGVATEDTSSPIVRTESGDTQTVYFDGPGQFPFYCDFHYSSGMMGVVYVKPAPN